MDRGYRLEKIKWPELKITKGTSQHQQNRLISYVAAAGMTIAFIKESATNALEWKDYIGYGIGMAISYSPVLAVKIMAVWKGQPEQNSPDEATAISGQPAQKGVD
jgi:hypothetical protein